MSALPHDQSLGRLDQIDFGSKNEMYVYAALRKFEIPFEYQVPIFGGSMRGALRLDFLVFNPFKTALQVHGEYWHRAAMRLSDEYELNVLLDIFKQRVVILWGNETDTYEEAEDAVKTWIVERPGISKY